MRLLGDADRELLETASDVIGLDEVGRGCLAGPVVVAGAAFDRIAAPGDGIVINDSKVLTARQREAACRWIRGECRDWVVVEVWVDLIDRINILEATRLAMRSAARGLAGTGSCLVVDQVALEGECDGRIVCCPKADERYFAVAAASILAKVHRDRLMGRLAARHGLWHWDRNKGYGTQEHRLALTVHGRSFLHRRSFRWSPVLR